MFQNKLLPIMWIAIGIFYLIKNRNIVEMIIYVMDADEAKAFPMLVTKLAFITITSAVFATQGLFDPVY